MIYSEEILVKIHNFLHISNETLHVFTLLFLFYKLSIYHTWDICSSNENEQ